MSDIDDIPRSIFLLGVHHAYAQTDGTYAWPNSREGDLLRQGMKEVEHLRAQLAAHVKENEALGKQQGEFIEEIVKLEQQRDLCGDRDSDLDGEALAAMRKGGGA